MKILFLSFTCEDIGVVMVTNMISQLQESFSLRRVVFYVVFSAIIYCTLVAITPIFINCFSSNKSSAV